jgi:hypothetical protein
MPRRIFLKKLTPKFSTMMEASRSVLINGKKGKQQGMQDELFVSFYCMFNTKLT